MSTLKKIHYVVKADRNDLENAIKVFHKWNESVRKEHTPERNETLCGKIMTAKYVTSKLTSITCNECLNKLKK